MSNLKVIVVADKIPSGDCCYIRDENHRVAGRHCEFYSWQSNSMFCAYLNKEIPSGRDSDGSFLFIKKICGINE